MIYDWHENKLGDIGSTFEREDERGAWFITTPGGEKNNLFVELRYGRREPGKAMPRTSEIGNFASAGEAMLAADMFDRTPTMTDPDLAVLGFKDYFPGAFKLDLRDGHKDVGTFVLVTAAGGGDETGLRFSKPRATRDIGVMRLWSAVVNEEYFPVADGAPRVVERVIAIELLTTRLAKGIGRYQEPLTADEYKTWSLDRFGAQVDPDADRPYVQADPETRNEVAKDLLLSDEHLRWKLGITPGYRERVEKAESFGSSHFERFLATLMIARPAEERSAIMDMLDAKVEELSAANAPKM
jgi:hypothetical protein